MALILRSENVRLGMLDGVSNVITKTIAVHFTRLPIDQLPLLCTVCL